MTECDDATSDDARRSARVHAGNGCQSRPARTRAARHGRRADAAGRKTPVPLQPPRLLDQKDAAETDRIGKLKQIAKRSSRTASCRRKVAYSPAMLSPIRYRTGL